MAGTPARNARFPWADQMSRDKRAFLERASGKPALQHLAKKKE
jgi:hypothetical protein